MSPCIGEVRFIWFADLYDPIPTSFFGLHISYRSPNNENYFWVVILDDNVELTRSNCPKERLFEWFIEPLFVMKQQIKGLRLNEDEEICLKKLIMQCKNDKPEEWDDISFPSSDTVRRAQLQAIIRR